MISINLFFNCWFRTFNH